MKSSLSLRRRLVFCVLDALTAVGVLALLAVIWSRSMLFVLALALLAGLSICSAACLWVDRSWSRWMVRIACFYQLALLFLALLAIGFGASYLWGIYGQVGTGAALVFLLIGALLVELFGLLPLFKLRALGWRESPSGSSRSGSIAAAAILAGAALLLLGVRTAVALDDVRPLDRAERRELLADLDRAAREPEHIPAEEEAGAGGDLYVLRLMSRGETLARLQARGSPQQAARRLIWQMKISKWDRERKPTVVVDRVAVDGPIIEIPFLFSISIVPGLDGVLGRIGGEDVALLPQELINAGLLVRETPLPFVRDFRMGVRRGDIVEGLCRLAGKGPGCQVESLRRIRGESWLWHPDLEDVPLVRGRPPRPCADRSSAIRAAKEGGDYVVRSLEEDGRFTYLLDPLTGRRNQDSYSLPRHAGTTWFLVQTYKETGDGRYLETAEAALQFITSKIRECGQKRLCIAAGLSAELGTQSLALIALTEHARVTGSGRWMSQILGLAQMVQGFMKPDGDFHHVWNLKADRPLDSRQFYMSGQAALALSMVAGLTGEPKYTDAARKAMDYLAGPYWDFFLGKFFFIEEHWTCLAAREAWDLFQDRRHADLCIDIGFFLRELQHRENQAFEDYLGGVGFTPFFPPHTTPTATRAEAMIAAAQLAEKTGRPAEDLRRGILQAIGFLMQNQYGPADAYLLHDPERAYGGIAWNFLEPTIRIDAVQHACSVMLLGGRMLDD